MLALALLSLALGGAAPAASADTIAPDCESRRPTAAVEAWVAMRPVRAADTVVTARVCVVPKSAATKIGSYHGELRFDSTVVRVVRVEKTAGGMRAENATKRGLVKFAGATPDGFPHGAVMSVVLRLAKRGQAPTFSLSMLELNTVDGQPLLPKLVNHSAP